MISGAGAVMFCCSNKDTLGFRVGFVFISGGFVDPVLTAFPVIIGGQHWCFFVMHVSRPCVLQILWLNLIEAFRITRFTQIIFSQKFGFSWFQGPFFNDFGWHWDQFLWVWKPWRWAWRWMFFHRYFEARPDPEHPLPGWESGSSPGSWSLNPSQEVLRPSPEV